MMMNLRRSILKRLLKIAYRAYRKEFLQQAVHVHKEQNGLGRANWMCLWHEERDYAVIHGEDPDWFNRMNSTFNLLKEAGGIDSLKSDAHITILSPKNTPSPLPSGRFYAQAVSIDDRNADIDFIPSGFFWNLPSLIKACPEDYEQIVEQISQKGRQPFQDERIFWNGDVRSDDRRRLREYGNHHAFCHFRDAKATPWVEMVDYTRYKYLLDLASGPYGWKLKFLLFSHRPVFVVERDKYEFWHEEMKPWEHFIPVARDLSDLEASWQRVENDPELYSALANNSFAFAQKHLTRAAALDYIRKNILNER